VEESALSGWSLKDGVLGCTGGTLTSDKTQPGPLLLRGVHSTIDYRNMELAPVVEK
jgi:hypothetical protein